MSENSVINRLKMIATSAYNEAALRSTISERTSVVQLFRELADGIECGKIHTIAIEWYKGSLHSKGMIIENDNVPKLFMVCLHPNRHGSEEHDHD